MDSSSASSSTSDAKAETTAGCGCSSSGTITVRVTPTTGGQFDLQVAKTDSVENLKKLISKKLKVPKERICLLHRDRQLRDGTLQENQLMDGSRLTLLPSVETGLLAQRPEQSVMQALESLNDSQVNDFLSGKAPLNLTMRLGDHMMLIQLQLSTVTPSASRRTAKASAPSASSKQTPPTPKPPPTAPPPPSADAPAASASSAAATASASSEPCRCEPAARPTLDTRALAEASRNLTQTLKQLSSEDSARARRQGAIIESMHHHGKGVYSGTFSGTLNPALQDRFGRPKRDISTIIHILNDLLCATPQYRRHARHASQAAGAASATATSSTATTVDPVSTTSQKPVTEKLTPSGQLPFSEESVSLSKENQATRGKMEHLRLIMEERRARRRARREARAAPYTTQWSAKSESLPTQQSVVEPMETTEQSTPSELSPPEPVVA